MSKENKQQSQVMQPKQPQVLNFPDSGIENGIHGTGSDKQHEGSNENEDQQSLEDQKNQQDKDQE